MCVYVCGLCMWVVYAFACVRKKERTSLPVGGWVWLLVCVCKCVYVWVCVCLCSATDHV